MEKYVVSYYGDDSYQVWNIIEDRSEFIGTLLECEAWIRLNKQGYIKD